VRRRQYAAAATAGGIVDDEMPSLYKEQEKLLISRGELEGRLMANTFTPLQSNKVKGAGSSGGFGAKKAGSGSSQLKAQAKAHAKTMQEAGVVRIDNVLSGETADAMRSLVYDMRHESEALVREGKIKPIDRFADVLLKKNRCDMPLPLGMDLMVAEALNEALLKSPVGRMLSSLLGDEAVLYELSCLMSDPGSQRQVVHPDTPYIENQDFATMYTCFVALQDITIDMGPTTWIPGTHTKAIHQVFQDDNNSESDGKNENGKDRLLRTQPSVIGVLPKGSCGIYDSRLLHCGGANQSDQSRALFYFTWKNPKVGYPGNPGSIRKELIGKITLKDVTDDLKRYATGKPTTILLGKSTSATP